MSKPIRIVLVIPGEPRPVTMFLDDDDIDVMRFLLGCDTLECVPIGGGIDAWCDEEAIANGKPQNGCGFLGAYFFASREGPEMIGLSDEQINQTMAYWQANKDVQYSMDEEFHFESFDSMEEMMNRLTANSEAREHHFRASIGEGE